MCVCGKRETPTVRATGQCEYIHMSGLVSHDKGGGEAVFVVEGAAANRVTHPGDRSVTWGGHQGDGVKHQTNLCSADT